MFLLEEPFTATLKLAYYIRRREIEHAVAHNVYKATPHSFRLSVRGSQAEIIVDNVPESRSVFTFSQETHGCFSLASNGTAAEAGAFRYVKLTVNGKTLLDIDFTKIRSVDELETYFSCYYLHTLTHHAKGLASPIKNFWSLNERGHLVCSIPNKGRVAFGVIGPYAMLTLRNAPIGDFDVEIGVEQSWRKYGVVFGCEKREFPFYCLPNQAIIANVRGGFACIRPHSGACKIYGNIVEPETFTPLPYLEKESPSVTPLFRSKEETTLPLHTLTYHLDGNMTYDFGDKVIKAVKDSVLYLPPNTPCRLTGETDRIFRVEFQCDRVFEPQLFVLKEPDVVKRLFTELYTLWFSNAPNQTFGGLSLFYRIMAELSLPASIAYADITQEILNFIYNHFNEPNLTIKEIADALNISESHLYHTFQDTCNTSPKEYILNFRMQHACTLLKTGQYKVYEVAEKSGFSDAKYFMTIFKKRMGVSPKKYALST